MNDIDLKRQLAFLQISQEDRQLLEEVAPALQADASRFSDEFYRHLFAFPETAKD